ncbi:hypothetical protein BDZ89DRAFT_1071546, partial [Hymenopellis radicata]
MANIIGNTTRRLGTVFVPEQSHRYPSCYSRCPLSVERSCTLRDISGIISPSSRSSSRIMSLNIPQIQMVVADASEYAIHFFAVLLVLPLHQDENT